jgi:hypothetical protein
MSTDDDIRRAMPNWGDIYGMNSGGGPRFNPRAQASSRWEEYSVRIAELTAEGKWEGAAQAVRQLARALNMSASG